MISPDTPTSAHDDDLVRLKLKNYRMKTSAPPTIPPHTPKATTTHRSRHSRGPSLSSPVPPPPPQRTSPPLGTAASPFRSPSQPSHSRPPSHHQRRSSVSNRRESLELMGGVAIAAASPTPSSPPSDSELSQSRESALRALEGRRPLAFIKGFEQVVVPEWKTPDVEARFDWAQASKALTSTLPAFGTASLAGKRDSFGKSMVQTSSLKDQLHTLLEEEEEEEDPDVTTHADMSAPSAAPARPRLANLRLDASPSPLPTATRSGASAAALARLRPLSLSPLPSPALTPSPRLSSLPTEPTSPGMDASPSPAGLTSPSSSTLRPLSLLTHSPVPSSVMPSPQSAIFTSRSGKLSSSGSSDSAKQVRRASTLSYRSSISSAAGSAGRASPAFSLSSSAAADHVTPTPKPATPTQDRALALQITYLQQENATLLSRIAALEVSLAEKDTHEHERGGVPQQDLASRIDDLESQVELLKTRVERERKETWAAKEVARRLSERVWEFERASASPSLPHSKATSAASSPRSGISGRSSGTSSFWAGSASGGQSVGSMTDVEEREREPWGPPPAMGAVVESLDVVQEEEEPEDTVHMQDADMEEDEDEQEVDPAHGLGIEVSLLPESASSAEGAQSGDDSLRGSVSAFSMSSASTSEAEAQSMAVLEGMADGDMSFEEEQPAEDGEEFEDAEDDDDDDRRAESPASLPNPYSQNSSLDMLMAASAGNAYGLPATPTTPTPRTPTRAALPQLPPPPAPSPAPPRHAHTPSQAAFALWKFPRGVPAPVVKRDEEKDVFFSSLQEDDAQSKDAGVGAGVGVVGRQMGKRERKERKKSIMRPWLGDDEDEEVQPVASAPVPEPTFVLHPAPPPKAGPARVSVRPQRVSMSAQAAAPAPTWSLRQAPPPSRGLPAPASSITPPSASSGFSFTKLTSVFSSWVAPAPAPSPPIPTITVTSARQPAYYAPPSPTLPAPRVPSPPRAIHKEDQPRPMASPLEKLDFCTTTGGQSACRRCVGPVIEL